MKTLLSIMFVMMVEAQDDFLWNRWEERTVDCLSSGSTDSCTLLAPTSKTPIDLSTYKCRREPMPQTTWNTLATNSTTRIACPLKCPPNFDLSVLQKKPYVNKNCQKYYTYGKYRDEKENDWYIWMTKPCVAAISTHCRFNDVKSHEGVEKKLEQQTQTKPSEQRKVVVV